MFYKILSEDSEKTIVKVNTFSNKNKNIHLICDPDFDSIGICSISNIPFGIYSPEFKELAIKEGAWRGRQDKRQASR